METFTNEEMNHAPYAIAVCNEAEEFILYEEGPLALEHFLTFIVYCVNNVR